MTWIAGKTVLILSIKGEEKRIFTTKTPSSPGCQLRSHRGI